MHLLLMFEKSSQLCSKRKTDNNGEVKKMDKGDIIKGGLTTTAVGLGGYTAGVTTTGIGDGNFWKGFLTLGLVGSVVEGTSGDCSAPEPDVIVRTEDCNDYALTEERAQMIYDKLRNINNNDVIPATLYTESPEAAEKLINIMKNNNDNENKPILVYDIPNQSLYTGNYSSTGISLYQIINVILRNIV